MEIKSNNLASQRKTSSSSKNEATQQRKTHSNAAIKIKQLMRFVKTQRNTSAMPAVP